MNFNSKFNNSKKDYPGTGRAHRHKAQLGAIGSIGLSQPWLFTWFIHMNEEAQESVKAGTF